MISKKFEEILDKYIKDAYEKGIKGEKLNSKELLAGIREDFLNSLISFGSMSFKGIFSIKSSNEDRIVNIPKTNKKVRVLGKRYSITFTKSFKNKIKKYESAT